MPGFRSGFKESFSEPASLENTTIADLQGQDLRIKRSWANEGSFSPVGSAEGKRPEFVSAKRVQTPLQGVCTTIERTDESRRAHQTKAPPFMGGVFAWVDTFIDKYNCSDKKWPITLVKISQSQGCLDGSMCFCYSVFTSWAGRIARVHPVAGMFPAISCKRKNNHIFTALSGIVLAERLR